MSNLVSDCSMHTNLCAIPSPMCELLMFSSLSDGTGAIDLIISPLSLWPNSIPESESVTSFRAAGKPLKETFVN